MNDAGLVGTVLDLTSLGVLDGGGDIHSHGADLRVRHQTARTEDLAKLANDLHGIRRGDDDVEVQIAGLDFSGQIVETDDIGASGLGCFSLFALGENSNANGLAGTCRQHH